MYLCIAISVILIKVIGIHSRAEFIVYTNECKIPSFPIFSEEANEVFVRQNYTSCTESDPLTYTMVENNTAYLFLDKNEVVDESLNCCYSYVTRNGSEEEPDIGIAKSDCLFFNDTIKLEQEIVMVTCENESSVVYENVHNPIIITPPVQEKLNKQPVKSHNDMPISVLIIVIDSVSRANFNRTMPSTRAVLLQNDFIDFRAYNKIDDNTFPNAMALLSGMSLRQVLSMCNPVEVGGLEQCPIIWQHYRNLGYATSYAEDWSSYATFNYRKKGFQEPPTDYYFKPYVEAAESLDVVEKDNMPYCTGPETEEFEWERPRLFYRGIFSTSMLNAEWMPRDLNRASRSIGERILNLAMDFALTFKNKPSFGIFWMNTFSHNDINSPSGMDDKVADFFAQLRDEKVLKDSLVMLLSDHGIRFGKFRQTIQGWFEERLPVNFISVPWILRKKFPTKYRNFKDNANKLISTYDVYMTLQHVLKISKPHYNVSSSPACPKCQSLFSNIPQVRSCKDAGIPEAWCTCTGEFTTEDPRITDEVNEMAATLALEEIKRLESEEHHSTSVTKIWSSAVNKNRLRKSYLLIVLQTDTEALYQALLRIRGDPVDFVRVVKVLRLW